ncbi:MAG: Ribulokinase [Phycisphaerae bacterium]|nr:Ribulokinase [Phycisphaerae bacterium]
MSAQPAFAIGLDFGTASVRILIVDVADGTEIATAAAAYASGRDGVIDDERDPNVARQDPADHLASLDAAMRAALAHAAANPRFSAQRVVGIGVDTTGSTPLPVDAAGTPLAMLPDFSAEPPAMAWLWKDHTAHAEAAEITEHVRRAGLPYLTKCGGAYSSEWFWSKILHCERHHPRVAKAAHAWVEHCDWLPGWLIGDTRPQQLRRSICAAGHKAMYHPSWGGLPARDFLESLAPGLSRIRERFAAPALPADRRAGLLDPRVAARLGLPPDIPVAVGAFDAHCGAVGAGVGPGALVKIVGTSTCDCMVAPLDRPLPDIPGVCGIVPESILPGMYGIEAGQSAVGDIFNWFVGRIAPSGYGPAENLHESLTREAARLAPGESGLLALDWHNGNRTILTDPLLTGLIVGETLATTPAEIYRALIEATAFGALRIIERIEEYGVEVAEVINCGGIAEKNALVMQIYADVCNRPMKVSRSPQTCALGAAIFGAVVGGAYPIVADAQRAMTGCRPDPFVPNSARAAVYRRLYALYRALHDAFGVAGQSADLSGVMKELIRIRQSTRL